MKTLIKILILLLPLAVSAIPRGSGVGNGGDVVDSFLDATRFALTQTLFYVQGNQNLDSLCYCKQNEKGELCQALDSLTPEQRDFCHNFIFQTYPQYLSLNRSETATPFTLSPNPILVPDPSGTLRPVAAKTDLGPSGDITFDYNTVKDYSPAQMLQLLGHEFGHKVSYPQENEFITDNDPIGPFTKPGGGRTFLDTVGVAITHYAIVQQQVAPYFGIEDKYNCTVSIGEESMESAREVPRVYSGTGFDRFETEFQCEVGELDAHVLFTVKAHEEAGCAKNAPSEARWTELELWRHFTLHQGESPKPPEEITSKKISGWNPLCDAQPSKPVSLSYQSASGEKITLQAQYTGMHGQMNATGRSARRRD